MYNASLNLLRFNESFKILARKKEEGKEFN
jgi:hypothetical protein